MKDWFLHLIERCSQGDGVSSEIISLPASRYIFDMKKVLLISFSYLKVFIDVQFFHVNPFGDNV